MKKVVGILGSILCVSTVYCSALSGQPDKIECSTDMETDAGFTAFLDDIEPIMDIGYEEESFKRTQSKIEANEELALQLEQINITSSEIELLAHLVRCEAGNQSIEGKRAVVDVILNRIDSEAFPDNVYDVIYQSGQFACVTDGNWEKYANKIDETDYEAIELELANRTNTEIVYFSSQNCANGELVCVIGDHYFAKR